MKKVIYLFFAGMMLCFSASAQSELTYRTDAFQSGIFQNETKLNASQVRKVMAENSEALALYKSGKTLSVAGCVVAYPSAFLLGWDLGTRMGGGTGNGTLLAIGATGTLVGIIMGLSGEKKIKKSIQLYNSNASNHTLSYQVNFGFTQTGIGLNMQF